MLGDIIVGVDGVPVNDSADLYGAIDEKTVGNPVRITVLRGPDFLRVEVPLRLGASVTDFNVAA